MDVLDVHEKKAQQLKGNVKWLNLYTFSDKAKLNILVAFNVFLGL